MSSSLYRWGAVKKCILCVVGLVALVSASANADEMVSPPAQFITSPLSYLPWMGFYAGINGGYGWGNSSAAYLPNNAAALSGTCLGGGTPNKGTCIPQGDFDRNGGLAGGQVGFNWQFNRLWLAGVEADYQWSDFSGTGYSPFQLGGVGAAKTISTLAVNQSVGSFGTLRARAGALIIDSLLLYGTGGLAVGHVSQNLNLTAPATGTLTSGASSYTCTAHAACFAGSSSQTAWGWTVGAGAEYAITSKLTFKGELLYVHLEAPSATVTATANAGGTSPASFTANFSPIYFAVLRGGLNYRF
jgi:outer membrane immunogenic protein